MDRMSRAHIQDYLLLFGIGLTGLLLLALGVGHHFSNSKPLAIHQLPFYVAFTPIALGIFFSIGNVHLLWLRPLMYRRRMGSLDGFQRNSGWPLIAGMCLVSGSLLAPPSIYTGSIIVFFALVNPGGMHWAFLSAFQLWRTEQK